MIDASISRWHSFHHGEEHTCNYLLTVIEGGQHVKKTCQEPAADYRIIHTTDQFYSIQSACRKHGKGLE